MSVFEHQICKVHFRNQTNYHFSHDWEYAMG